MDKSDNILANQRRIDVFEFDINHEIKELIKWYSNRINMEYGTSAMDDLGIRQVFGQTNKYVFS